MDDILGPAHVQYTDFEGTAALDGHGGPSEAGILEAAGLDPKEWAAVGFEVGVMEGFPFGHVDVVEWSALEGTKNGIPGLAEEGDGTVHTTRFPMLEGKPELFLGGFKRWMVRASYKGVAVRSKDPS